MMEMFKSRSSREPELAVDRLIQLAIGAVPPAQEDEAVTSEESKPASESEGAATESVERPAEGAEAAAAQAPEAAEVKVEEPAPQEASVSAPPVEEAPAVPAASEAHAAEAAPAEAAPVEAAAPSPEPVAEPKPEAAPEPVAQAAPEPVPVEDPVAAPAPAAEAPAARAEEQPAQAASVETSPVEEAPAAPAASPPEVVAAAPVEEPAAKAEAAPAPEPEPVPKPEPVAAPEASAAREDTARKEQAQDKAAPDEKKGSLKQQTASAEKDYGEGYRDAGGESFSLGDYLEHASRVASGRETKQDDVVPSPFDTTYLRSLSKRADQPTEEELDEFTRDPMWRTLRQFRGWLPLVSRVLPLLDFASGQSQRSGGSSEDLRETMEQLQVSNKDVRLTLQDQMLEMKRVEEEVARMRDASEKTAFEHSTVVDDMKATRRLLKNAFLYVGILLGLLVATVGYMAFLVFTYLNHPH